MNQRPAGACLTHRPPSGDRPWRRVDDHYRTCSSCYDQLHRWLSPASVDDDGRPDSIPGLYAFLNPRPVVGDAGRRRPGFGSRSPALDHVICIRDRRSVQVEDGDPYSAPGLLTSWVQWVWEERYEVTALDQLDYFQHRARLPTTVETMCLWLDQQLDWITRQETVIEFYDELRALHAQLRSATGDGGQPPVGWCIELVGDAECGAPIHMPRQSPRAPDEPIRDLPELKCGRCGSRYSGTRILRLQIAGEVRAS